MNAVLALLFFLCLASCGSDSASPNGGCTATGSGCSCVTVDVSVFVGASSAVNVSVCCDTRTSPKKCTAVCSGGGTAP